MPSVKPGLIAAGVGIAVNMLLAIVKIVTGIFGNSYALIADGIESTADIVTSLVVWTGLKISALPADDDHPFGHGKAEPIAGLVVALALLAAAAFIAFQSVREIITPHHAPAWFTLPVLAVVIVTKETLYRFAFRVGSTARQHGRQGRCLAPPVRCHHLRRGLRRHCHRPHRRQGL